MYPQTKGDENHRPGFDNWRSQLDRPGAQRTAARRASAASQSPHRHLQVESLYRSTGFLLICIPKPRGMRTTDRGSTTGAASWTDRARSERLPEGRAQRVNPPHRHLQVESLYRSTGFLLICIPQTKGDENHRPGFDNWRSQLDRPGAQRTAARRASAASQSPSPPSSS